VVTAFSATVNGVVAQGAAYLYSKAGDTWSESQKLTASDGGLFDNFGASVAISSEAIAIGANGATVGQNPAQGAVYVFTKSGSTWVQTQKLVANDGAAFDNFGLSVAMEGPTIVVGSPVADDGASGDSFGESVALNKQVALVGAYNAAVNGHFGQGAAYIFTRSAGMLVQSQKLVADDGASFDNFGNAVALDKNRALIGADVATVDGHTSQGKAYLFTASAGTWTQAETFVSSDGTTDDFFGAALALEPGTALIATPHPVIDGNSWQGAAYFDSNPRSNTP
jgi:hypothetical protein